MSDELECDGMEVECKKCGNITGPSVHGGCQHNNHPDCPWASDAEVNSSKVDWNKRYMDLAQFIAGWSKDKSTGVGAVIVKGDGKTDLIKGYNGFPRGINDDIHERHEKPAKYVWTEHAERNAIYKAAREGISTDGCMMYVNYFPCVECSRAIIGAGIIKLVAPEPDLGHEKWGESWTIATEMLTEAGVEIEYYERDL